MTKPLSSIPVTGAVRRFLIERLRLSHGTLLLGTSIVIGLAAGFAALAFEAGYHGLNSLLLEPILENGSLSYVIIIIPVIGGLLVGLMMKFGGKGVNGHGVPEVIESVNLRVGLIRFKNALLKTLAAVITLGFGGSAGPEGPMVHIGSAFGSVGGRTMGSSEEHTKVMIGCGAAAGLAAIFHAPIAGVIFVLEVILVDFSLDTFIPVIVASVTATVVTRAALEKGALLVGSTEIIRTVWHVPLFIALGLLCAILSVGFIKFYSAVDGYWKKLKIPGYLKPALGGLFVGLAAYKFPQIMSDGYNTINTVLAGPAPIMFLLALIGIKLIATSMTLGSGGSGGMFAPTLFLGAMMGSAFGGWLNSHFPGLGVSPGSMALVGMGATMAGTLFAPVTAVIMIFEITNNYSFILPLMIASITSVVLARRLSHDSIYTVGLSHKGIRLHEGRDENILRTMNVGDIMRQEFLTVGAEWPLSRIFDQLRKSPYSNLPVLNEDGTFAGILPFETLRLLINENSLSRLLIAKDLFNPDLPTLRPDEDLRDALAKFANQNTDELPVICDEDSRIMGMLSRGELLVAYNHELLRRAADSDVFRARPIRITSHIHDAFDRFLASFRNGDVLGYKKLRDRSQGSIRACPVKESTHGD